MSMGAHEAAMLVRATNRLLILALINILAPSIIVTLGANADVDALLRFKNALGNNMELRNWNRYLSPCHWNRANWIGVLCLKNGTIWGLQLEHMELKGTIDVDSLALLPHFRTLSLMDNRFTGPLPEVKKLTKLKALYLSNNQFSGTIPDDAFEGMGSLKRLYLANNMFTGKIPYSLTTLPRLTELRLEGNQFQGLIPDFKQKGLRSVYLASNDFAGPIPPSLSHLNPNSFSGNKELCGRPLDPCVITAPTNAPIAPAHNKKSNILRLIIIVIVIVVLLTLAVLAVAICYNNKNTRTQYARTSSELENSNKIAPSHAGDVDTMSVVSSQTRRADVGKLSFLKDDIEKFDLQDLLRASAEVLGSGTFGASYKAVMKGQSIVVKRYKHMNNVGREEFNEHMRRIGRLKHPNLLPLAAYYYRREEKLLVSEFVDNGSLASHLHGNHSKEDQGLDWQTRLKIIKGVARGLSYLYTELPTVVPHGHLKSSNVLLDESNEPLLTDYALRPVINAEHAHLLMTAYKSPEYAQRGRSSNKTDIWNFGILILELLTGKFPENYLTPGFDRNADLATWVNSMVKEKKTGEVFDKEMSGTKNSKSEMINLLKIGLSCCEEDVERRLDIKEVVKQIEQLKEGDHEEFGNEGNAFSRVRSITEGDFSSNLDR